LPYNYSTQTVNEILVDLAARATALEGGTTAIGQLDFSDSAMSGLLTLFMEDF